MSGKAKRSIQVDGKIYWRCSKCQRVLLPICFNSSRTSANGLRSDCRICQHSTYTKWESQNKNRLRKKHAQYRAHNREKLIVKAREWRYRNSEYAKAYDKTYKETHKDEIKNWRRKYREKNKDSIDAYQQKYDATRDERKVKARAAVRHAVRDGVLVKPKRCDRCGMAKRPSDLHGHHFRSYKKKDWLRIKWLCASCHQTTHKKEGSMA